MAVQGHPSHIQCQSKALQTTKESLSLFSSGSCLTQLRPALCK